VLALDEGGRIVLAAITSGDRVVLSAESTALALVQLAYGRPFPGITQTAQVDQIRAVATFPALVAAPPTVSFRSASAPAAAGLSIRASERIRAVASGRRVQGHRGLLRVVSALQAARSICRNAVA